MKDGKQKKSIGLITWEHIADNPKTLRAKVPNGWLVLVEYDVMQDVEGQLQEGFDFRPALTFVNDPEYGWK